ncbi:hypothetical protein [Nostoc sp. ChiQUE01b]|uniref:hypothetical protein n=1 Tax=Nostoc sp. ChiQUE01b TaxID=3075376 RepID=UPI002AD4AF53|nr:hypothetical protein [Nostoc sp. ChiQUE01b]MDZ8260316.1 hypothetical protein [Nostoc sp. ChiQUE01b]
MKIPFERSPLKNTSDYQLILANGVPKRKSRADKASGKLFDLLFFSDFKTMLRNDKF